MNFSCFLKFLALVCMVSDVRCIFTEVVEIGQGKLRGLRSISGQNRYYGIPYAVSERFQPPLDPPRWTGMFNAINRISSCAQAISIFTLGTEDCLHLDVYTPEDAKLGDNLPVIMFTHGGAYYYGSKAHYDPEFLVTKGIVAIVINYRVGVLGFLCLGGVANLGLKDQVAALKWIQKNIAAFGGDPDNVTLCGQSAGASAAAMHLLSLSSRGLFHKAILLSGSPIAPWAFNLEPLVPSFEDAKKLGPVNTTEDVLQIFKNAALRDLLTATRDTSVNSKYFKYSPCVEINATEPFFPDKPFDLIKSGQFNKVPIIIGFADVEGMLFYGLHNSRTFKDFNVNFHKKLPSVFSWCSKRDRLGISKKIRKHYFGSDPITSKKIKGVVNYYSDWIAYSSINAFSELMIRFSDRPVYNYIFSYEGGRNFAKLIFGSRTGLKGASHSDDIFYIFKPAGLSLVLSNGDKLFIDQFTTMLTNFMKTGNPTPQPTKLLPVSWLPNTGDSTALRLNRKMTLTTIPYSHRGHFWLKLLCDYGAPGFVPCESKQLCHI